jgi:hypothetical protein
MRPARIGGLAQYWRTIATEGDAHMDDTAELNGLNEQFIEAFRQGSWELLAPILAPSFAYLDGATGEVWEHARYVDNLRSHPAPALALDQVVIHVDQDTAVVSGRTSRQPGIYRRYLDTYQRQAEGWRCVHACVWALETQPSESGDERQLADELVVEA